MSDVFDTNPTPDSGAISTPASPVADPSQAPANPTAGFQSPTQAPATGATGREGWVPRYRIDETRQSVQRELEAQYAQERSRYEQELNQIRSQLHALVGVKPQEQVDPQVEAIREQFSSIFPGLSKLEAQAAVLMKLTEQANDFESQSNHYWTTYGKTQMDRLYGLAAQSYGTELDETGKRFLHQAFVNYLQSSPELANRYTEDPNVVNEFWDMYSGALVNPARRIAAAGIQGRVPGALPQDAPSGVPRATPTPQPRDMDERTALAWAMYANRGAK